MLFNRFFGIVNAFAATLTLCVADETVAAPESMITPAPAFELVKRNTIKERQADDLVYDGDDFIGYYTIGEDYYASTCPGDSYGEVLVSGNWYGGCQGIDSYMTKYTACDGAYAYGISYYLSGTYSGNIYDATTSCYALCEYDFLDSGGSSISYFVQCQSESPFTFYQMPSSSLVLYLDVEEITTPAAPTTTSQAITTPITAPITSSTTAPIISTTSRTTSVTPVIISPTPDPEPSKKSIAGPVAGGVIGGLAFVAAIAALIFILLKKKRSSGANVEGQNQPIMMPQSGSAPEPPGAPAMAAASMPEKVAMNPSTAEYTPQTPQQTWSPPPPQQTWAPPPQGYQQNMATNPPQQTWSPPPQGHPQSAPTSPAQSPPPPMYFAGQPQPPHH